MTITEFLGLKKPAQNDFYNVDDFNNNADIIDAKLKSQSESLESQSEELGSHTSNKENPHGVTKSQIGLGNVPNVATNDQTPVYSEASTLTTLESGEKLSVAFGKIKKAITDLIAHIGNTRKHVGIAAGGGAFIGADSNAQAGGGAVGNCAQSLGLGGFAGGDLAFAKAGGGAVGYQTSATDGGGAVGYGSSTSCGFAGGFYAVTFDNATDRNPIDAIQLGTGENTNERTLQVYSHQLLDADGFVPRARLPVVVGSYTGTGTYISGQETTTNIKNAQNTIQFPSYPRYVLIKRRAEDFWTAIAPNPEDNSIEFMSYGGNNYSGGLCSGSVSSDYKMTWYAHSQRWSYKANTSTGVVSIQLESIASSDAASLKPINQLNWQGEIYDYIAFCD